jgi:hypothetical protein
MRIPIASLRTLTRVGTVLVVMGIIAGLTVVGVSAVSAARAPTLSFRPNTSVGASQAVVVTIAHFTKKTKGGLSQCNMTTGEPTIVDPTTGQVEPVGCAPFTPTKTTASGTLPAKVRGYGIDSGVNGPPASGTDSAGTDAAHDAQAYPCPPTSAEIAAGGSCVLVFTDVLGQTASEVINYNFESTTTTTVTIPPGCTPESASNTVGSATITVDPGTCLVGGEDVTVTGTGLTPNSLSTLLECNTTAGQPTVATLGTAVPVGCTSLLRYIQTTTASGDLPVTTFTIVEGTVGPPATGTDSAGGNASTDAANYPCPPTAAQVSDGVSCDLRFSDEASDVVAVPLVFYAPTVVITPTSVATGPRS